MFRGTEEFQKYVLSRCVARRIRILVAVVRSSDDIVRPVSHFVSFRLFCPLLFAILVEMFSSSVCVLVLSAPLSLSVLSLFELAKVHIVVLRLLENQILFFSCLQFIPVFVSVFGMVGWVGVSCLRSKLTPSANCDLFPDLIDCHTLHGRTAPARTTFISSSSLERS